MDEEVHMARRVFISFRFSDGEKYKTKLCELFDGETKVINCSENEDRSGMSEETIQKYLYSKLKTTSVTIIIITPQAINHKKDMWGRYDDWMYDEIRYSLEDRENNRCRETYLELEKILDEEKPSVYGRNKHTYEDVTTLIEYMRKFDFIVEE